jgi:hypothetical protein
MRSLFAVVLLLAACGPCPKPPTAPAAPGASPEGGAGAGVAAPAGEHGDVPCARYGTLGLYAVPHGKEQRTHPAFAEAEVAYETALMSDDQQDPVSSAKSYLACAVALRAVPDDDWQRALADQNADVCYYNVMVMYANAGRFASEGRAVLDQAAADDPRLADKLRGYLAEPLADCAR